MSNAEPQKFDEPIGTWRSGPVVTAATLGYAAYFGLIVVASIASLFVDALFIVGGLIGLLGLFVIFRYPFVGFIVYMLIYFLRPGERVEALAPLRIELTFGVVLLLAIVIHDALKGTRIRFPKDKISIALLCFIAALWIGVIFSVWKSESLDAMIAFVKTFVLYYFVVVMANNEKRFQITFWLIVGLTSLVGLESAFNYFTGNYSVSQGIMRAGGSTSFGEHSNSLAMYMANTIPMLIYLWARYRGLMPRALCLAMGAICFVTLMITGSRSGVLCLIGTALTYAWFSRHRVALLMAIVMVSVMTWFALPQQYKERYGSMTSQEVDASSQGRLDAWMAGARMFLDYPITGVGPRAFAAAYLSREGVWLYSHSLYVELVASMGLLGTATWAWFLWAVFARLKRLRDESDESEDIDTAVFVRAIYAVLVGLLIAGVFGHILFRDTFYVVAALVVSKSDLFLEAKESV